MDMFRLTPTGLEIETDLWWGPMWGLLALYTLAVYVTVLE